MESPPSPPPPPPPPGQPKGSLWRAFRACSWRVQAAAWAILVLAALFTIGALSGGDKDAAAKPPATPAKAVEAPPEPTPPAEPVDTGRMSADEWDRAHTAVTDANDAVTTYANTVGGRCALISGGGQLAEAITCIDDAYGEMETTVVGSYSDLDSLKGDVAKTCRKHVIDARDELDLLFRALSASKDLLTSGKFEGAKLATMVGTRQAKIWKRSSRAMLAGCRP